MERNDAWVGGPLPKIKRVIWRMVPQAGNRRALLERGDADISYDLPNKDFQEMKAEGKLKMVSLPFSNGIQYIGMNVTKPPFDNLKVRQAVAYAMPYQKIMDAVMFGLANPMFGAPADKPTEVAWPQPHKYKTDMAKAKALMAEAGSPAASRPRSRSISTSRGVNEPLCVLVQESLGQIGIKTTINKVPGANWRTEMAKKDDADDHQLVLRLARLSGILLLLVLSRQEFDLQHHELQVARRWTSSSTARARRPRPATRRHTTRT